MIPLLIAVPFGPLLAWKRGDLFAATQRLYVALGLSLFTIAICYALIHGGPALAPLGIGLAVWVMIGSLSEIQLRIGLFKQPLGTSLARLVGLPRTVWGTAFGHFGLGMTVLGLIVASAYQSESILVMKPGDKETLSGYTFEFTGFNESAAYNYQDLAGHFNVTRGEEFVADLHPVKRVYTSRNMPTTETAIHTIWGVTQIYMSLGDKQKDGGIAVRIYHKPWVTFIWLGTVVMFIGGCISLSDRRLRIGAPARKGRAREAASKA